MTIKWTFKKTPGTKEKDRVVMMKTYTKTPSLLDLKALWQMEQDLNRMTRTRVHVDLIGD